MASGVGVKAGFWAAVLSLGLLAGGLYVISNASKKTTITLLVDYYNGKADPVVFRSPDEGQVAYRGNQLPGRITGRFTRTYEYLEGSLYEATAYFPKGVAGSCEISTSDGSISITNHASNGAYVHCTTKGI